MLTGEYFSWYGFKECYVCVGIENSAKNLLTLSRTEIFYIRLR